MTINYDAKRNALRLVALCLLVGLAGAPAVAEDPPPEPDPPAEEAMPAEEVPDDPVVEPPVTYTDPRDGEAPLPATAGWHASLVMDNEGVGIWTVKSYPFLRNLACPEVIGLDDRGRCHVLMSYSGRWTPISVLHDGSWLGGLAFGDVDPRVEGAEVYTGSQKGNIYQVRSHGRHTLVDGRHIARIEGREIHTLVAGDLDPRSPGKEVIVFTRPGGLYRLSPTGPDGTFLLEHLMDLPGRVRDAILLPSRDQDPPRIATVSRTGKLATLELTAEGAVWKTIYEAPMGMGRIARRPTREGPTVLYTTHDDGRILRHEKGAGDVWRSEVIYNGPMGPRGIAAGRFDADPAVETVAIFGYSRRAELLTRTPEGWMVERLFTDTDKGHWLAAAELDGRNGTHELLASGYSGRIVLLARPPGYGRPGLATTR